MKQGEEAIGLYIYVSRNAGGALPNRSVLPDPGLQRPLFFYRFALHKDLDDIGPALLAKKPRKMPVVLSQAEVGQVRSLVQGTMQLILKLIYGSGMRLNECPRLRIKDLDFERSTICVREGICIHFC